MVNLIPIAALREIPIKGNLLEVFESKSPNLEHYSVIQFSRTNDKDIGNYQLPRIYRSLIGEKASKYLEDFPIDPTLPDHAGFTICKIYKSWPNCGEFIKEFSLKEYFGEHSHEHDESLFNQPANVTGFKAAENMLLDYLVDHHKMEDGYYLPIPFEKNGVLQGMIYLLYDKNTLHDNDIDAIESFRQRLEKRYG
ncbi:MAG: hypothetical protein AB8H47_27870 [Bacteroidia bacterium]